jgi:hypothetical protein
VKSSTPAATATAAATGERVVGDEAGADKNGCG